MDPKLMTKKERRTRMKDVYESKTEGRERPRWMRSRDNGEETRRSE